MSLREVLETCGALPLEQFQLASIKDKVIRCTTIVFPDECPVGDAWAVSESAAGQCLLVRQPCPAERRKPAYGKG